MKKKVTKKTTKKKTTKLTEEKVEEVKEIKKSTVQGKDAVVLINVFAPDHEPQEYKVRIPNITQNAGLRQRTPSFIAGVVVGGLKRKYGDKVK